MCRSTKIANFRSVYVLVGLLVRSFIRKVAKHIVEMYACVCLFVCMCEYACVVQLYSANVLTLNGLSKCTYCSTLENGFGHELEIARDIDSAVLYMYTPIAEWIESAQCSHISVSLELCVRCFLFSARDRKMKSVQIVQ